jgi:hypothetical protein
MVRPAWMERLVMVEFGPSRPKRFGKALVEARNAASALRWSRVATGPGSRWAGTRRRTPASPACWSASCTGVRPRSARGDEPLPAYQAKEMAWCASSQLKSFGTCRFRFYYGVLPRCALCPLFDAERAILEGENPPPALVLEVRLTHTAAFRLGGSPLDLDRAWEVPDFPPQVWGEPAAEEPPG